MNTQSHRHAGEKAQPEQAKGNDGRNGFRQEVEDFLRVVEHGGELRTSARDALETHRLMHRILEAAGLPALDESAS